MVTRASNAVMINSLFIIYAFNEFDESKVRMNP